MSTQSHSAVNVVVNRRGGRRPAQHPLPCPPWVNAALESRCGLCVHVFASLLHNFITTEVEVSAKVPEFSVNAFFIRSVLLGSPYGLPDSSVGKESACNAGDPGWIPGSGRSPGEGIGYPLQYSGLENSTDSPWGRKELDMPGQLSLLL